MPSFDELALKNGKAKRIAQNAMQERLGLKTDLDAELEGLQKLIDDDVNSYMGKDTPPPDYLMDSARRIWIELLQNAPEMHFKQTEYDLLAQYCWCVASIRTTMGQSAIGMDMDELSQIQKLQSQMRFLATKLRLSPQRGLAQKTQDRILTAKDTANAMREMVEGKVGNKRSSLMFGAGENNDVQ